MCSTFVYCRIVLFASLATVKETLYAYLISLLTFLNFFTFSSRHRFSHCTVITIAHRLNTIIHSDRVLVLDAGEVLQFDTPSNLLKDQNGIFYHLVQQTGPQMASRLMSTVTRGQFID